MSARGWYQLDKRLTIGAAGGNRSRFLPRLREQWPLQVIALLGAAWLIVFSYVPLPGIYIAFSDYKVTRGIFGGAFVGLKHFAEFLTDKNLPNVIINTLAISGLNLTIGFVMPIIFALLLNELKNLRYKRVVQTVSYLPHFLSWVVLGGFLISWTSEYGLINQLLMQFNLIKTPTYLLSDEQYFWWVALISQLWKETGWNAILFIAAIAGVSQELYESATLDGANRFQKARYITVPGISSTIAILFILQSAYILSSNFDQIFVLRNTLNANRSTVLDIYTYRIGIQLGRFSYSTAVGLTKSVISLLLLLITNKVSERVTGSTFLR